MWTLSLAGSGYGKSNGVDWINRVLEVTKAELHRYLKESGYMGSYRWEILQTMVSLRLPAFYQILRVDGGTIYDSIQDRIAAVSRLYGTGSVH
jgi:hypothetical protein